MSRRVTGAPSGASSGRGAGVLAEAAYVAIKRSIIRCELEPGQQVTEEQLGTRFGVGRAAVRAALKRLYQEQLIHSLSRNRYVIAPITLKYVNELFELRLLLEPPAARLAAGRIDAALLERLTALAQARYETGDRDSAAAFLAANTEFHATVAEASGNSMLARAIRDLLDKVERVHHMSHLLRDRNEEAYHEHHDLVDALAAGDGERAERVMTDQILAARAFVIDAMLASAAVQSVNVAPRQA
ncbi:MAG: GntR family transcriptional regulator [Sphaerobacter sp.]|nr:GntR family transcriptional regulator [Sphaerobacter sp.]